MQVIKENSKKFLEEMNAKAIALTLYGQDLIPESVKHDIENSKCREHANGHLSNVTQLRSKCRLY